MVWEQSLRARPSGQGPIGRGGGEGGGFPGPRPCLCLCACPVFILEVVVGDGQSQSGGDMVSVRTACLGVGVLEIEGGVGVGTDQKTAHKAIQAKRGIGGQGPRGAPQRGVVGMVRASLRGPLWGGGHCPKVGGV